MRISKGRAERDSTKYKMIRREMSRTNPWYIPLVKAGKTPEVGQIVLDLCPRLVRKREKQA